MNSHVLHVKPHVIRHTSILTSNEVPRQISRQFSRQARVKSSTQPQRVHPNSLHCAPEIRSQHQVQVSSAHCSGDFSPGTFRRPHAEVLTQWLLTLAYSHRCDRLLLPNTEETTPSNSHCFMFASHMYEDLSFISETGHGRNVCTY